MPQPFLYSRTEDETLIHGVGALQARPALAASIAIVCVYWNSVERALALMFIAALAGRQGAAMAIYNTLVDRRLKYEAFRAIAEASLSRELRANAEVVFSNTNKVAKRRNIVVHGVWAALPSKPASILLDDSKEWAQSIFDIQKNIEERFENTRRLDRNEITHREWDRRRLELSDNLLTPKTKSFMEYKERDFEDIISAMDQVRKEVGEFTVLLGNRAS